MQPCIHKSYLTHTERNDGACAVGERCMECKLMVGISLHGMNEHQIVWVHDSDIVLTRNPQRSQRSPEIFLNLFVILANGPRCTFSPRSSLGERARSDADILFLVSALGRSIEL